MASKAAKDTLAAARLVGLRHELVLCAVVEADFRKNEATNFAEWSKKHSVKPGQVVLFLSKSKDQMVFVHGFSALKVSDAIRRVLWSERLRLDRGTWNPLMLVNYAERVGLGLVGLKRFEDFYKKLTEK